MKVTVDKNKCIGCGACAAIAPKSFRLKAGKAEPIDLPAGRQSPPRDEEKTIQEAVDSCPVQAIKYEQ